MRPLGVPGLTSRAPVTPRVTALLVLGVLGSGCEARLLGGTDAGVEAPGAPPPAEPSPQPGCTEGDAPLPAPPVRLAAPPGWGAEHLAFALGASSRPVGGPARWAIGGGLPAVAVPAENTGCEHALSGASRLYFSDQQRHFWIMEGGALWPIIGSDDLGEEDGPAEYARFIYTGVYGGSHSGMVAAGEALYVADNALVRRLRRQPDGAWVVETVAGRGARVGLAEGETAPLAEFGAMGKGLAISPDGTLFLTASGGLLAAGPDGGVRSIITRRRAEADLAERYAVRWPGVAPQSISLGSGETLGLSWHPNGSVYGIGRQWPPAWRVTLEGRFEPLVGYAPTSELKTTRYGPGDPGLYPPHVIMGGGVTAEGWVALLNEIPYMTTRYEFDRQQVTVLDADGGWSIDGQPFRMNSFINPSYRSDGSFLSRAPEPGPSATSVIRVRPPAGGAR